MIDKNLRKLLSESVLGSIPELPLPSALKLLVLAPHPDDLDAIGVTLRFLSQNSNSLDIGVLRTGSGVEDSYRPGLTLADKADIREREQRASLQFFGLPQHCLTFLSLVNDSEDRPVETPANRDAIKKYVSEKDPDIIFMPHGNDTNSGHRATYSLFVQVAQQSDWALIAFLNRDPKTIDMRTNLYMPLGKDEANWKATLLRFHDSQHQRNLRTRGNGFDDRILEVHRAIARELSLRSEYAEAFEIEFHNFPENES
jgi:LmbE family N-acetylglucosaminyl deacetylase